MHGTVCTVKTVQTSICLGLVAQKQDGGETMAKCLCFCITKADSCLFAFTGSHSVLKAKWWRRKKPHVVIKDIVIKGSGSVSESRRYCSIPLSMKGLLWAVALSSRPRPLAQNHTYFCAPWGRVLNCCFQSERNNNKSSCRGNASWQPKTDNKDKNNTLNTLNAERAPSENVEFLNSQKASDALSV